MKTFSRSVLCAAMLGGLLTGGATTATARPRPPAVAALAMTSPATITAAAAVSTTGPQPRALGAPAPRPGDPARGRLARLDNTLFALAQAAPTLAPANALGTLRALAPGAHFRARVPDRLPSVMIDAIADADVAALRARLLALGLTDPSAFSNDVGGWLPVDQLGPLAALPELRLARVSRARTRAGSVTSQGDFAQRSDVLRAMSSTFDGRGVTVGVLSDSVNCFTYYEQHNYPTTGTGGYARHGLEIDLAKDVASADLSAGVNVLKDADCADYGAPDTLPWSDEGRAMLQIVHDVAPGAGLAFYTAAFSEADFASGIVALADAGARVIVDDVGYPDEPMFQDGPIAQAVDQVRARGVAYFSSAGNEGRNAYENARPAFPVATSATATNANEHLLNFDASGKTTTTLLPITIPSLEPGEYLSLVVQWDQPYVTGATGSPGASSALDLCLTDSAGNVQRCSGANTLGQDPILEVDYGNPASASGNTGAVQMGIEIGLAKGAAPGLLKFSLLDDGAGGTINAFQTNSPTVQGHPGAAGAAAVGAAFFFETPRCGTSPATLEDFSSAGGDPILFDTKGQRLATPVIRQKPDFVDADGGNDTFLGYVPSGTLNTTISQCRNAAGAPLFFGTSAAAPHAAGVAALLLQASPALTPAQIVAALGTTASPMGSSSPNYDAGSGFVQADAAFAKLGLSAPMPAPTTTPATTPTPTTTTPTPTAPPATAVAAKSGGGGALGWPLLGLLGLLGLLAPRPRRRASRRVAGRQPLAG